jgi:protein-disulfide isomerase
MRMSRILSAAFVSCFITAALANPAVAFGDDKALFNYKGKAWKKSDLSPGTQQAAFELEMEQYEKAKRLADAAIFDMHLIDVAKSKNKPIAEVEKDLLKIKDPSDSDAKSWFEKNKDRIPYPFEQVKGEIKRLLVAEQSQTRRQELVQKLKKDGKFSLLAQEPVAPSITINTLAYPVKGNASSKVTVVEFADYQCPHCRQAAETMKKIFPRFKDKIQFVFMDFPINPSGVSRAVAEGAFCANEQKKFWEYHDLAFSKQNTLNKDSPIALAKELKLDEKAFDGCMKSGKASAAVEASKAEAERIGVSGTPAIYVNGRRQLVAHTEEEMTKMIEKAVSQK